MQKPIHQLLTFFCLFTLSLTVLGQQTVSVEPPNWYTEAKNPLLQLLIKAPDAAKAQVNINYAGVKVVKQFALESPNYKIVLVRLEPGVKAGKFKISLNWSGSNTQSVDYELIGKAAARHPETVGTQDAVYLITPDRFANGDPGNDQVKGYLENADRSKSNSRHGGDLLGIKYKLPYLKDLGLTTVWINPVLENNMPHSSYHGYAITDFYKIDDRFGTLTQYKDLIADAHSRGMKVVKDMVLNHAGSLHPLYVDPPAKSWFNKYGEPNFRSNFRASVVPDPHASKEDMEVMTDGWFDSTMPDINQRDTNMARYMIQNTLWWIWTSGIDGIRMDTYPYPDKDFMIDWAEAIDRQFPGYYLVGEVWVSQPALASYWTTKRKGQNTDRYKGNLPTITDFPLHAACNQAFNQNGGWDDGFNKIYHTLAQDFVYDDASKHLVFLDNHDVNRFCSEVGMDTAKMKLALTFLATVRGVPQIYYGTEIMLRGRDGSHPELRQDFPGGWPGDKVDLFNPANQSKEQKAVYNHLRKLLNWRKTSKPVTSGTFTHYVGDGNVYVYGRQSAGETVVVLLNNKSETVRQPMGHYRQLMAGYTKAKNILTGEVISDLKELTLPAKTGLVLEMIK